MAKLRGSITGKLKAVAETLQVILNSAVNEKQLREMISGLIKNLDKLKP